MSFFEKIKNVLSFGKKPVNQDVKKEEVLGSKCLIFFTKDETVQQVDEVSSIFPPVPSYEEALIDNLIKQYDAYIKEIVKSNYSAGKVEKLYKIYASGKELLRRYPEETEKLIKYYGAEFEPFFYGTDEGSKYVRVGVPDKNGNVLWFKDMSYFRDFIERNYIGAEVVITDEEYTALNEKIKRFVPAGAIRGMVGTYTGYSLSYENYLLLKEQYPQEVACVAAQETGDEEIWRFIGKVQPYLERREIHYMV